MGIRSAVFIHTFTTIAIKFDVRFFITFSVEPHILHPSEPLHIISAPNDFPPQPNHLLFSSNDRGKNQLAPIIKCNLDTFLDAGLYNIHNFSKAEHAVIMYAADKPRALIMGI